jgi:predicted kinase
MDAAIWLLTAYDQCLRRVRATARQVGVPALAGRLHEQGVTVDDEETRTRRNGSPRTTV